MGEGGGEEGERGGGRGGGVEGGGRGGRERGREGRGRQKGREGGSSPSARSVLVFVWCGTEPSLMGLVWNGATAGLTNCCQSR